MSRYRIVSASLILLAGFGAAFGQPGRPTDADARNETDLARRVAPLLPSLRAALTGNNPETQRAALATIETVPPGSLYGSGLAAALTTYVDKNASDPALLAAALRALGKSRPDPKEFARLVGKHAKSDPADVRLAAADALNSAIQIAATPLKQGDRLNDSLSYLAELIQAAKPALQALLADGTSATRQAALSAIQTSAARLGETYTFDAGPGPAIRELAGLMPRVGGTVDWDDSDSQFALRRMLSAIGNLYGWASSGRVIQLAIADLGDLTGSLAGPLADSDATTRMAAIRTAGSLASLRRLVGTSQGPGMPPKADSASADGLKKIIPLLADKSRDLGPQGRLAVLSAAEQFADLTEARPLLFAGANDREPTIRWTAARALGARTNAAGTPAATTEDIEVLTRLANDSDMDVRAAALAALERFGAKAKAAGPVVIAAAIKGDAEPRLAALKTLSAIGTEAKSAVPALIEALRADDLRLKRVAAIGLARFRADAKPALPDLRVALTNADPELRISAAEAILAIERQPRLTEER